MARRGLRGLILSIWAAWRQRPASWSPGPRYDQNGSQRLYFEHLVALAPTWPPGASGASFSASGLRDARFDQNGAQRASFEHLGALAPLLSESVTHFGLLSESVPHFGEKATTTACAADSDL